MTNLPKPSKSVDETIVLSAIHLDDDKSPEHQSVPYPYGRMLHPYSNSDLLHTVKQSLARVFRDDPAMVCPLLDNGPAINPSSISHQGGAQIVRTLFRGHAGRIAHSLSSLFERESDKKAFMTVQPPSLTLPDLLPRPAHHFVIVANRFDLEINETVLSIGHTSERLSSGSEHADKFPGCLIARKSLQDLRETLREVTRDLLGSSMISYNPDMLIERKNGTLQRQVPRTASFMREGLKSVFRAAQAYTVLESLPPAENKKQDFLQGGRHFLVVANDLHKNPLTI